MTKEYIENLEAGQEIDDLVAIHVMGWHKGISDFGSQCWLDNENRFQHLIPSDRNWEDEEDFHLLHWHPSESWLWVSDVIEKIDVLKLTKSFGMSGVVWICKIDNVEIFEKDAPLAVCKAVLIHTIK